MPQVTDDRAHRGRAGLHRRAGQPRRRRGAVRAGLHPRRSRAQDRILRRSPAPQPESAARSTGSSRRCTRAEVHRRRRSRPGPVRPGDQAVAGRAAGSVRTSTRRSRSPPDGQIHHIRAEHPTRSCTDLGFRHGQTSRPRFMDTAFADVFIKWMSKINTFLYRRSGGEGLRQHLPGHPGRAADHHRPQVRRAAGQPAVLPPRRRPRGRRRLQGRQRQQPDVVPQPQGRTRRSGPDQEGGARPDRPRRHRRGTRRILAEARRRCTPTYDDYQSWTDRTIPIVICDP